MAEWLYHLPVVWMALVVCAGTSLVTGAVYGAVLALATGANRVTVLFTPGGSLADRTELV